jgi:hypothetical protein
MAFGCPARDLPAVPEPSRLESLADGLSLTTRIASRLGRASLHAVLGPEAADRFHHRKLLAVAADVAYLELMRKIGDLCAEHALDLAFLKHGALLLEGVTAPGSREACDIDVLVSETAVSTLFELLVAEGFRPSAGGLCDHQAPALHHPSFGTVEIHRFLPGVRKGANERFARLEDLRRQGVLGQLERDGVKALALDRTVFAAHLVSHGIAQHGDRPDSYPILRMFGDLSDLGIFRPGASAEREQVWSWCRTDVPRRRFDSVLALGLALEDGVEPARMPANARRLLEHIVAGTLDADYVAMMRLALFKKPLSDDRSARLAWLLWTVFPGKGSTALEKTANAPGLPRLLRNPFLRPFALLARFGSSLAATYRIHRRGGRLAWG